MTTAQKTEIGGLVIEQWVSDIDPLACFVVKEHGKWIGKFYIEASADAQEMHKAFLMYMSINNNKLPRIGQTPLIGVGTRFEKKEAV